MIPPYLQWLEWVAGSDLPQGNEDLLEDMERAFHTIADRIRGEGYSRLDTAIGSLLASYPAGDGRDQMEHDLKAIRSGPGSIETLADGFDSLGASTGNFATEMSMAKWNGIISLGWLAGELAWAAFAGPGAPFAQAGAIAATQQAFRWMGGRLLGLIDRILLKLALNNRTHEIVKKIVYEIVQEALVEVFQGTTQEFAVQTIHLDDLGGYRWGDIGLNAGVSAIAGGVGGAAGGGMHSLMARTPLDGRGWRGALGGGITGLGAGGAGALAAWGSTGMFTGNFEFDPRMLVGGMLSGVGPSAIHGYRGASLHSGAPIGLTPDARIGQMPGGDTNTVTTTNPTVGSGGTSAPGTSAPGASSPGVQAAGAAPGATQAPATAPGAPVNGAGNGTGTGAPSAPGQNVGSGEGQANSSSPGSPQGAGQPETGAYSSANGSPQVGDTGVGSNGAVDSGAGAADGGATAGGAAQAGSSGDVAGVASDGASDSGSAASPSDSRAGTVESGAGSGGSPNSVASVADTAPSSAQNSGPDVGGSQSNGSAESAASDSGASESGRADTGADGAQRVDANHNGSAETGGDGTRHGVDDTTGTQQSEGGAHRDGTTANRTGTEPSGASAVNGRTDTGTPGVGDTATDGRTSPGTNGVNSFGPSPAISTPQATPGGIPSAHPSSTPTGTSTPTGAASTAPNTSNSSAQQSVSPMHRPATSVSSETSDGSTARPPSADRAGPADGARTPGRSVATDQNARSVPSDRAGAAPADSARTAARTPLGAGIADSAAPSVRGVDANAASSSDVDGDESVPGLTDPAAGAVLLGSAATATADSGARVGDSARNGVSEDSARTGRDGTADGVTRPARTSESGPTAESARASANPDGTTGFRAQPETTDTGHPGESGTRTRPGARDLRNQCGKLALRRLRELTGNRDIRVPRRVGMRGMSWQQMQKAANAPMIHLPPKAGLSPHVQAAIHLKMLGPGSAVLMVDRQHGPVDEHDVGAHAYVMYQDADGRIMVDDPRVADRPFEFDPANPPDVTATWGIFFTADGDGLVPRVAAGSGAEGGPPRPDEIGNGPDVPADRFDLTVGHPGPEGNPLPPDERVRDARVARDRVVEELRRLGWPQEQIDDARVLVSELVANSLDHTPDPVRVEVTVTGPEGARSLRIDVFDTSEVQPEADADTALPDEILDLLTPEERAELVAGLGERGRGLRMLADMTDESGSTLLDPDVESGDGPPMRKTTWFVLHEAGAPETGAAQPGPGALDPATVESEYGVPRARQEALQAYADAHQLVITVRPSNPDTVPWILAGYPGKPELMKAKSINDLDVELGAPADRIGLVGFFRFPESASEPGELRMPERGDIPEQRWRRLESRLAERRAEYEHLRASIDDHVRAGRFDVRDGVVYGKNAEGEFTPLTGDHDLFDIRRADGSRLSPFENFLHFDAQHALDAGVEHPPLAYWNPDDVDGWQAYRAMMDQHGPGGKPLVVFRPGEPPTLTYVTTAERVEFAMERARILDEARADVLARIDYLTEIGREDAVREAREQLADIGRMIERNAVELAAGEVTRAVESEARPAGGEVAQAAEAEVVRAAGSETRPAGSEARAAEGEATRAGETEGETGAAGPRRGGDDEVTPSAARDPEAADQGTDVPDRSVLDSGTAEQVGRWLHETHGLEVTGFDDPAVGADIARQLGRALDTMLTRYPHVDLRSVRITDDLVDPDNYAETHWFPTGGRRGGGYTESISFNRRFAVDPAGLRDAVARDIASGHTNSGHGDRPAYSLMVHEFGHAMVAASANAAQQQQRVETMLTDAYLSSQGRRRGMSYRQWLGQLSDYSFHHDGRFDAKEGVPEAFADVEVLGERASEPARLLHRMLVRESGAPQAGPRRGPGGRPVYRPESGSAAPSRGAARSPDPVLRAADVAAANRWMDLHGQVIARAGELGVDTSALHTRQGTEAAVAALAARADVDPAEVGRFRDLTGEFWSAVEEHRRIRLDRLRDMFGDIGFAAPGDANATVPQVLVDGTPAQVADFLTAEYGIRVVGFDADGIDPGIAREFAAAVHDMMRAFPKLPLREIRIADLESPHTVAETRESARGDHVAWLGLNKRFAMNPADLRAAIDRAVESGNLSADQGVRPVHGRITHELGHALDIMGGRAASTRAMRALQEHYRMRDIRHPGGFDGWLRQLSGYAFKGGGFVPHEAIAEAFAQVRAIGEHAPEPARVLAEALVSEAQAAEERARRAAATDGTVGYQPAMPAQGAKSHLEGGVPKTCAPEALTFARDELGITTITPLTDTDAIALRGVDPDAFARAAGADWHRGGFRSLDEAAALVRDTGARVLGVIEFTGLTRPDVAGAHAFVMFRAPGGAVVVHERVGDEVREFVHTWGQFSRQHAGVYGIVFDADGVAEHPLTEGAEPSGVAGQDRPTANVAGPLEAGGSSRDTEVVAALRAGDPDALGTLRTEYRGPLVRAMAEIVGDPDMAADIVAETFARARAELGSLGDRDVATWLGDIAGRIAPVVVRVEGLRTSLRRDLAGERTAFTPEHREILTTMTRTEVRGALARMDPVARRLILTRYEGVTTQDSAAVRRAVVELATGIETLRAETPTVRERVADLLRTEPRRVQAALDQLTGTRREFAEMHYRLGLSPSDSAAAIGLSPGRGRVMANDVAVRMLELIDTAGLPGTADALADIRIAQRDNRQALRDAVALLTGRHRWFAELRYVQERSIVDVAHVMGESQARIEVIQRETVVPLAELVASAPDASGPSADTPPASPNPAEVRAIREAHRTEPTRLAHAMSRLSPDEAKVVTSRLLDHDDVRRVASAMRRSEYGVESLLRVAVRKLAAELAPARPAPDSRAHPPERRSLPAPRSASDPISDGSAVPRSASDPTEADGPGAASRSQPEGADVTVHLKGPDPKNCAPEVLRFLRALTGNPEIGALADDWRTALGGTDPDTFAATMRADWHPGGFTSVAEAAALVADTGVTVAAVVEFRNRAGDDGVGAHGFVLYRGADGRVMVHEKVNGVVVDYEFTAAGVPGEVSGVYGVVFEAAGTARRPLGDGELPSARAGADRPLTNIGAREEDSSRPESRPPPTVGEQRFLALRDRLRAGLHEAAAHLSESGAESRALATADLTDLRAGLDALRQDQRRWLIGRFRDGRSFEDMRAAARLHPEIARTLEERTLRELARGIAERHVERDNRELAVVREALRDDPVELRRAILKLPPVQRQFADLWLLQDRDLPEIATEMNRSRPLLAHTRQRTVSALAELLSGASAPDVDPNWEAVQDAHFERPGELARYLERNPASRRVVLELALNGRTTAQIAAELDRSENAVRKARKRAADQLAALLSGVTEPTVDEALEAVRTAHGETPAALETLLPHLTDNRRHVIEATLRGEPLTRVAADLGTTESAARQQRNHAAKQLADWLVNGPPEADVNPVEDGTRVAERTTGSETAVTPGTPAETAAPDIESATGRVATRDSESGRTTVTGETDAGRTPRAATQPDSGRETSPDTDDSATVAESNRETESPELRLVRETAASDPEALRRAAAQLSPAARTFVELRFLENRTMPEIAEITGRKEATLWTTQYRAVPRLATLLAGGPAPTPVGKPSDALTVVRDTLARNRRALTKAMQILSADENQVVKLRILQDRSRADAATAFGRSEKAVDNILARAVRKLAGELTGDRPLTDAEAATVVTSAHEEAPSTLRDVLARMPEAERNYIEQRVFGGRQQLAIAAGMGKTKAAILNLQRRAFARAAALLRTELGPEFGTRTVREDVPAEVATVELPPRAAPTPEPSGPEPDTTSRMFTEAQRTAPDALDAAMAQLRDGERECLDLRYRHGLSTAEVAERMRRSERAVFNLERRALGNLAEHLPPHLRDLNLPDLRGRTATMNDLSAATGLSKGTIYAAFQGDPVVHPDTVARVFAVADRLGMRPGAHTDDTGADAEGSDSARAGGHRRGQWDLSGYATAADVGEALAARFPDHGLIVTGFDIDGVDVETAREFARAVDDVLRENPWISVREVKIGPIEQDPPPASEEEVIPAQARRGLENGRWFTESITFNEHYATRPELFARMWAQRSEAGHMSGPADRPVYGVIVHELGHALDYAGQYGARSEFFFELFHLFRMTTRSEDIAEFLDWAHTQLPEYAFFDDGTLDEIEALAEAFAAVHHFGENASPGARALDALLVAEAEAAQARRGQPQADLGSLLAALDALESESAADRTPTDSDSPLPPPVTESGPDADGATQDVGTAAESTPNSDADGTAQDVGTAAEPTPNSDDHVGSLVSESGLDLREASTAAQVGAALAEHLGIPVTGFDLGGVDPDSARRYALTLADLLHAHPQPRLGEVRIAPMDDDEQYFGAYWRIEEGRGRTVALTFNLRFAADPAGFRARWQADVDAGLRVGAVDDPVGANVVHEFGHMLDHVGANSTRAEALRALMRRYLTTHEQPSMSGFDGWLAEQFSGYSFDGRTFHAAEAVAEAFAAVTRSGENASDGARLLYAILMRDAGAQPVIATHAPSAEASIPDVDGAVLFEGDLPDSDAALYRGIPRLLDDGTVNPTYLAALLGVAAPRGDQDLDPADHITQRGGADSDTTSWSRSPRSARVFAKGDGLILEWRSGAPPEGAGWRFKHTMDPFGDFSQVLIQGTLTGARATRFIDGAHDIGGNGRHPEIGTDFAGADDAAHGRAIRAALARALPGHPGGIDFLDADQAQRNAMAAVDYLAGYFEGSDFVAASMFRPLHPDVLTQLRELDPTRLRELLTARDIPAPEIDAVLNRLGEILENGTITGEFAGGLNLEEDGLPTDPDREPGDPVPPGSRSASVAEPQTPPSGPTATGPAGGRIDFDGRRVPESAEGDSPTRAATERGGEPVASGGSRTPNYSPEVVDADTPVGAPNATAAQASPAAAPESAGAEAGTPDSVSTTSDAPPTNPADPPRMSSPAERAGVRPPGPVRQPGRPPTFQDREHYGFYPFDRALDTVVSGHVAAEGGRMVNARVGLVDGPEPRVFVVDWLADDIDATLTEALDTVPEVRAALGNPNVRIQYLQGHLNRDDSVELRELESPELWRTVVPEGHWAGMELTYWQDFEGGWRCVPTDIPPERIPPPRTAPELPVADTPLRAEYVGEESADGPAFTRIHYMTPEQRESTRLFIGPDGRLYSAANGTPFHSDRVAAEGYDRTEFVMDGAGNIYSDRSRVTGRLAHSSFLAGANIATGGTIKVYHGRLLAMDDRSGHYQPRSHVNDRGVLSMLGQGLVVGHGFEQLDFTGAVRPSIVPDRTYGENASGSDAARAGGHPDDPDASGSDASAPDGTGPDASVPDTTGPVSAGRPTPRLTGFDGPDVDPGVQADVVRAVDDALTAHPNLALREIRVAPLPEGVFAAGADGVITVNEQYVIDPALFQSEWENSESGAAIVGPLDAPGYGAVAYELGRLLDTTGGGTARGLATRELYAHFTAANPGADFDAFTGWLRRQFSFDSFGQYGTFRPESALAESFAALSHDEGEPSEGHRVLRDLLARQADPGTATPAPAPPDSLPFAPPEPDDGWRERTTADAVARRLTGEFGVLVTGFDPVAVDPHTAREYARAVDLMLTRHPHIDVREVRIAALDGGGFGRTYAIAEDGAQTTGSILVVNALYAADPVRMRHDWAAAIASGYCVGPAERPVFSTVVHEFGHAVDIAGENLARRQAPLRLAALYQSAGTDADFRAWVEGQLSGYGLRPNGDINMLEALAEAFAAGEHDPGALTPVQELLRRTLLDAAEPDDPDFLRLPD